MPQIQSTGPRNHPLGFGIGALVALILLGAWGVGKAVAESQPGPDDTAGAETLSTQSQNPDSNAPVATPRGDNPLGVRHADPMRFAIEGEVLVFDTENDADDLPGEIVIEDINGFREALSRESGIREVQLNSSGGNIYASSEIAWIIRDYDLDTRVVGECISACVDLFLAGAGRQMALGAKIGFHRRSWSPSAVESYYDDLRESQGWSTPFEFGSWIYEDTQAEMHEYLSYMVSRGVEPGFAIETLKTASSDEWYPSRRELTAAGVLRERE